MKFSQIYFQFLIDEELKSTKEIFLILQCLSKYKALCPVPGQNSIISLSLKSIG